MMLARAAAALPAARGAARGAARRLLCSSAADDDARARAFIEARGFRADVAHEVTATLARDWGVRPGGMLAMVEKMAGAWEIGADAGLAALAKAVERELDKTSGKALVRVLIEPPSGEAPFACEGYEGTTLYDVCTHGTDAGARLLSEYVECACSGGMACSTCHVYVDDEWADRVGPPTEEEEDMLDLAYERRDNSRLGCQIVFDRRLDGLRLRLPRGANNMFDSIPFE